MRQPKPNPSAPSVDSSTSDAKGPTAQARARANRGKTEKKRPSKKESLRASKIDSEQVFSIAGQAQPFKDKVKNQADDSPIKLQAQYMAYEMYTTQRASYNDISKKLGLNRKTVPGYIAKEAERRQTEFADIIPAMIARRINNIEEVEVFYFEKMHSPHAKGDEGRTILEAQKLMAALMGLAPGITIKHEGELRNPFAEITTAAEALAVLKAIPDGNVPRK